MKERDSRYGEEEEEEEEEDVITTAQAYNGAILYHVESLHEEATEVLVVGIRLVHNTRDFYIDYLPAMNHDYKILTDVNTSFTAIKPTVYA